MGSFLETGGVDFEEVSNSWTNCFTIVKTQPLRFFSLVRIPLTPHLLPLYGRLMKNELRCIIYRVIARGFAFTKKQILSWQTSSAFLA